MPQESTNPFIIPQLKTRHRRGNRLKILAASALASCLFFLFFFLFDLARQGIPAFMQSYIQVEIPVESKTLENPYSALDRELSRLISRAWLRDLPRQIRESNLPLNTTQSLLALASAEVDQYLKGHHHRLSQAQIERVEALRREGRIQTRFNANFFLSGDSKIPENSGLFSAFIGTILTMLVTMSLALPLGVMSAIYLEEFAKENRFTRIIEININNLAAIPSILFGLLGLAIFINFFGAPRSSPLVGGMTLALMSLPIIIVSTKAALKAIPASIRQAGLALGLTKWQIIKDHILPLAMPGILTGSIIALAQAMGETAPLIIIGMIAFIPDAPTSIMQAATVMPAQIFTWSGMPERAYIERTAAGILVLLGVLLSLNALAIYLRKKFEKKW